MRATGRTFRMLLAAIYAVSLNNSKQGSYIYTYSQNYAIELFNKTIAIMMAYGNSDSVANRKTLSITFPNKKVLYFKSMKRNTERNRRSIRWEDYDEFSDHFRG